MRADHLGGRPARSQLATLQPPRPLHRVSCAPRPWRLVKPRFSTGCVEDEVRKSCELLAHLAVDVARGGGPGAAQAKNPSLRSLLGLADVQADERRAGTRTAG